MYWTKVTECSLYKYLMKLMSYKAHGYKSEQDLTHYASEGKVTHTSINGKCHMENKTG